jgi:hypothetical protein
MEMIFKFVFAFEIPLIIAETIFPGLHGVLPIGGNHLSQMGFLLGFSLFIADVSGPIVTVVRRVATFIAHFFSRII